MKPEQSTRFVSLVMAMLALMGCTSAPQITSAPGKDPVSIYLRESLLPRTQEGLTHAADLLRQNSVPTPEGQLHINFVLDKGNTRDWLSGDEKSLDVTIMQSTRNTRKTDYFRGIVTPLKVYFSRVALEAADGHEERTQKWLRLGSSSLLANTIISKMKTDYPARHWITSASDCLRDPRNRITLDNVSRVAHNESRPSDKCVDEIPVWMATVLQEKLGQRFLPAWYDYFHRAARPDFNEPAAFREAFGIDEKAFTQLLADKFAALQAEKREHAETVPPPSGFASATDFDMFPLQNRSDLFAYQRYLSGPSPKAFAFSLRGSWGYADDDSHALSSALDLCKMADPVGCELYAVDNEVVFQPQAKGQAGAISVLVGTTDDSEQSRSVKTRWLTFVQNLAATFNEQSQMKLGVVLELPTRIFLVPSPEDYSRTLSEDLRMLPSDARDASENTAGLSNTYGQIVVFIPQEIHLDSFEAYVVRVTLHELTHELQGQLAHRNAGFLPPPWLTEGSANLLAARIAAKLPDAQGSLYSAQDLDTRLHQKQRLGLLMEPDQVFRANAADWNAMNRSKTANVSHYDTATLMVLYLEATLGERFYPALRAYYEAAADKHETSRGAFEKHFGMSPATFLSHYKKWLASL